MKSIHGFAYPDGWEDFFMQEKIELQLEILKETLSMVEYLPSRKRVFAFLKNTTPSTIRVIMIGKDPYDKPEQATGLAFSVYKHVPLTVSLLNIYKELKRTNDNFNANHGCLSRWRNQGVLLMNAALTVVPYSNSARNSDVERHQDIWRGFIINLLIYINNQEQPVVFVFLGTDARDLRADVQFKEVPKNKYMDAYHPADRNVDSEGRPSSRFIGSNVFTACNKFLSEKSSQGPVDWFEL